MIERTAEISITAVLVYASGLKSRPACPGSVKTGKKAMAMMSKEKKIAGVTSFAASARSLCRSASGGPCSSFLCEASIITISASTVAPMAMAMPPRLMIVEGMSSRYMGMKESATATGREMMGKSELRKWRRKRMITALTVIASSSRASLSVSMERWISPERS